MPHAIYLHSSLTQARVVPRNHDERRNLIRFSNREVVLALSIAGVINMAMVVMAAAAFHDGLHNGVAEIETAYRTLAPVLGIGAAGVFLLSLIASGVSSSAVGTMAGQVIMQGFVRFQIPLWLRRLVTMVPAFVVVALGVNATQALIASQFVLSLTLPVPMIALLILTRRHDVMGSFVSRRWVAIGATVMTGAVIALNGLLILQAGGAALGL
jgi:manganese transport protein